MPIKSKKQQTWLQINKPNLYKKWKKKYHNNQSPFKLKNIKANEGQMLKFFVLYDGCMAAVADEPVLCTSTSSGEEHLDALGIAMDDSPSLEKFLLQSCVVYAVSVAAN